MIRLRPWSGANPAEAIELRDWTLAVLADEGAGPAPHASVATWRFFLTLERCALPLTRVLAAVHGRGPDPASRLVLDELAAIELRTAMAAVAEVAAIDVVARSTGWKIVLLKGARLAMETPALHLQDVDVLVRRDIVAPLADRMEHSGYAASSTDRSAAPHLSPRSVPGSLPVEIHRFMKGMPPPEELLERAIPCDGTGNLWRLSVADELQHLLTHTVAHHPDRRGRIRDVLALSRSLKRAPLDEQRAARRAAATTADSQAVTDMLRLAERIDSSGAGDPFRQEALGRYRLLSSVGGLPFMKTTITRASHLVSERRTLREDIRLALGQAPLRAASDRTLVALSTRIPFLGPFLRGGGRVVRSLVAAGLARLAR